LEIGHKINPSGIMGLLLKARKEFRNMELRIPVG
jgi:hypothetical protein